MSKKVFKGWCRAKENISEIGYWDKDQHHKLELDIWRIKGTQNQYPSLGWPPRRVTVTIEVED